MSQLGGQCQCSPGRVCVTSVASTRLSLVGRPEVHELIVCTEPERSLFLWETSFPLKASNSDSQHIEMQRSMGAAWSWEVGGGTCYSRGSLPLLAMDVAPHTCDPGVADQPLSASRTTFSTAGPPIPQPCVSRGPKGFLPRVRGPLLPWTPTHPPAAKLASS